MRILIAEDDFISRSLMLELLRPYGTCDLANNGHEALEAFKRAHAEGSPYRLVCLDIMMPLIDGQEVLRRIRAFEVENKVGVVDSCRVIMTTALDDFQNIMSAFRDRCEAYLNKPIDRAKLVAQLESLGLIDKAQPQG